MENSRLLVRHHVQTLVCINCLLNIHPPADGGSVTWYEATPLVTTSDPIEMLPAGSFKAYEGSPVTLKWSYNVTPGLSYGIIRFNGTGITNFQSNGQEGEVDNRFKNRFSLNATPHSASLFIAKVTADDDKASGAFSCDLIASNKDVCRRHIYAFTSMLQSRSVGLTVHKLFSNA